MTGCAGFIGSHTCERLLKRGDRVLGIDNMNDYYDVRKKEANLQILRAYPRFEFRKEDVRDTKAISQWRPDRVCHLASMAGVRYSIQNPSLYEEVNVGGFIHLLEQCVKNKVTQLVYASSSSVYGLNKKVPFSEADRISTCNSPYACTKVSMERYARTYHQLYGLSSIGLRFFTVYGPRGRPDMAPYKFMSAIKEGREIVRYGDGSSSRDYTYVDDIVGGVVAALDNDKGIKCGVYNLGNSSPVSLNEFIEACEAVTGKKAQVRQADEQLGDVPRTYADITLAMRDLGYCPKTSLEEGLGHVYRSI